MSGLEIVVAMTPEHAERTLDAAARERLATHGRVRFSPSPADHHAPPALGLLTEADVVLTGTGTALLDIVVLDRATRLRAVLHAAGSVRPVVTDEVYDRGIAVSSQAAANALPVAEYTVAMILLELKGVRAIERTYRTARAEIDVDAILAGNGAFRRRIGIVSASHIGRRVIELLRPFDLHVSVHDPYLTADDAAALSVDVVDLGTLLSTCDLVSLHAPLLPATRGMIGAAELAALRDGATLVNTARGGLVDQDALIAELCTGRLRAVVDVTEPEIPGPGSPLWDLPNLVLTPHVAGSRGLELRRIGERVVDEVGRLARGEPLRYEVTRDRYHLHA
ncbi:hydroxyacid dehydrogenase [Jiangella asiatica]|uniref:Hydroxyacid dehydrogenase n=1 Tax=Jiangella asiatica TaxID=2530372 RepID=A0A4R5DN84_9ACTN|nr:hydroxyacid dehydrogenase [Jiangella asiatica]TDE13540.1 hydroxyacid dehydrogenase [Jiangella asiatica]